MSPYTFIIETVREAGSLLLKIQNESVQVSHKGDDTRDVLTSADIAVNNFLVEKIHTAFPSHHVCSEEGASSEDVGEKECAWMIDPIDGTANFARNIPHFAIGVAFLRHGEPTAGAVYNPITNELFSFEKGVGAFLNDTKVTASSEDNLQEAYALLHIGRKESLREWGLSTQRAFLSSFKKTVNLGSSALDLCFVGAGRLDTVVYGTLTTQDIAAAIGFVREAGGDVYTLSGTPVLLSPESQPVVATGNKELLKKVLPLISST